MEGGTPRPPKCAQVEGSYQEGPLGSHVGEAPQQESPCALLLLDDFRRLARPAAFSTSELLWQPRWTSRRDGDVALHRAVKGGEAPSDYYGRTASWPGHTY